MTRLKNLYRPKTLFYLVALIALFCFSPELLFSQTTPEPARTATTPARTTAAPARAPATANPRTPGQTTTPPTQTIQESLAGMRQPSLITQAAALTLMSLMPFIVMILTSFMKIVIVLSLLRNALGVQQAPPNQILNGVALMLSIFIMYPTALKVYEIAYVSSQKMQTPDSLISTASAEYIITVADDAKEPLREFLKNNSIVKHQALFYRIAFRVLPEDYRERIKPDDFMILVPSFITSQLKDAFEIGVLIYIPFFVIDLVTSNVLLAMGMMMLSPVTISMPLKLFLLVMLDGWTLLIEGLVQTFR